MEHQVSVIQVKLNRVSNLNLLEALLHEFNCAEVCTTLECSAAAKLFQQTMDLTSNPCDDFYQFVCGRWGPSNSVPFRYYDHTTQIDNRIFQTLRGKTRLSLCKNFASQQMRHYSYLEFHAKRAPNCALGHDGIAT